MKPLSFCYTTISTSTFNHNSSVSACMNLPIRYDVFVKACHAFVPFWTVGIYSLVKMRKHKHIFLRGENIINLKSSLCTRNSSSNLKHKMWYSSKNYWTDFSNKLLWYGYTILWLKLSGLQPPPTKYHHKRWSIENNNKK